MKLDQVRLLALMRAAPLTINAAGAELQASRFAIGRMIDGLVTAGFATKRTMGRSIYAEITPKGVQFLRTLRDELDRACKSER